MKSSIIGDQFINHALRKSPRDLRNFPTSESKRGGFRRLLASLHTPRNKTRITGKEFSTNELYNTKLADASCKVNKYLLHFILYFLDK